MAKKRGAPIVAPVIAPQASVWPSRAEALITRYSLSIFFFLVAIASARIISTYTVFNHTVDEPAHIACGMEWLDRGTYHYEAQHPPLSRVMMAILPHFILKAHSWDRPLMYNEGAAVLYTGNQYDMTLALARLGILPFFWLACWVVFWWTRRSFGDVAAFFATLCFTILPPALAHGGLATTDMALTATFGLAFVAMLCWLERPTWAWSAIFGLTLGLTVLSKFSVLVFFPAVIIVALAAYFAFEKPRLASVLELAKARLLPFAFAAVVACLIVWAGYRFSFDKVPAPQFWAGIQEVRNHNALGNPSYLLGSYNESGWWPYYEVVLAVKTPLAMIGLIGIGAWLCWKRRLEFSAYWIPFAFIIGILAVGAASRINIGVRHVLPVYLAGSVIAGIGAKWLWTTGGKARWILGALLLWMIVSTTLIHPDYLAYFNEIAGDRPERIIVDSDLDWGQDMKRLSARLHEVGATEVAFDPFIIAHLEAVHGFPPIKQLDPREPLPGWNAVSLTMLKLDRLGWKGHPELIPWPELVPQQERVGKGVLLYYFPPKR